VLRKVFCRVGEAELGSAQPTEPTSLASVGCTHPTAGKPAFSTGSEAVSHTAVLAWHAAKLVLTASDPTGFLVSELGTGCQERLLSYFLPKSRGSRRRNRGAPFSRRVSAKCVLHPQNVF